MADGPVRCRPAFLKEPSWAANKGARAYREHPSRSSRLMPYPAKHFLVIHHGLLPEAARHVENIELRCARNWEHAQRRNRWS
jgi:hypothetical protein